MGNLLLALLLILLGITWAGWVAISGVLLGLLAILTGVVLLVENRTVVNTYIRR